MKDVARFLEISADRTWMLARVAALLSPYYEKDVPQGVRKMEAEDWAEALQDFPQWAITNAVRWWKGENNPDRRRRPLEGDIVDRCRAEMMPVRAARMCIESGNGYQPRKVLDEPAADRGTPEQREEIARIVARMFPSNR